MSSIPGCPRSEAQGRAGFTLVELLVALVIGGILTTVLLQLMQGNGRFVAMQSAREEVQQNGRASLDLIAGDLRAVPPQAIRDMDANSIRFFLPRAWGVLCNAVTPTTLTAFVLFPAGAFPGDFQSNAAQWGVALEQTTVPSGSPGRYQFVTRPTRGSAGTQCNGIQPNAGDATRYLTAGFTVTSSLVDTGLLGAGAVIQPGTQVMVFEEVRYDVAASTSGPAGRWIRRMSGYTGSGRNMQPMAGPLPRDTSLVFRYLQEDGVSQALDRSQIRRVRIWLEVQSRSTRREGAGVRPQQVDTMTTDVILRNR